MSRTRLLACLGSLVLAGSAMAGTGWTGIATSVDHSVAIAADGTLWSWGDNGSGQLGDGTARYGGVNEPRPVGVAADWAQAAAGRYHTLAVRQDGSLWAWGANGSGQLGDGGFTQRTTPVRIGTGSDWVEVAAGADFSVALRDDGSLWSWGGNGRGQLGDGTTVVRAVPKRVGLATGWVEVSAGYAFAVARRSDGTLWAWGENNQGELGNGTLIDSRIPVQVGTDSDWAAVEAGWDHVVALKLDGSLWAWGKNSSGQLGLDGTASAVVRPTLVDAGPWLDASAGVLHSLAVRADGTLWTFGDNWFGQLGDGTTTRRVAPVQVGGERDWQAVSAGSVHSVALKRHGAVYTVGRRDKGQLGDRAVYLERVTAPVPVAAGDWAQVGGCYGVSFALKGDGSLWYWGRNVGRVGYDMDVRAAKPAPKWAGSAWRSAACTAMSGFGIRADGSLWAWGENTGGLLGDGTTVARVEPVPVAVDGSWAAVAPDSDGVVVALNADGTLWGWGAGRGVRPAPLDAGAWRAITPRMGVRADGSLWSLKPQLALLDPGPWRAVAGRYTGFGIREDGTLWSWKLDAAGRFAASPRALSLDTDWTALSAAGAFVLALRTDGSLWGWSPNDSYGELGNGPAGASAAIVRVGEGRWRAVAATESHVVAVAEDGGLWAWGYNLNGETGDGSGWSVSPVRILGEAVADTDGDGLADGGDNCPLVANPEQSDADADGLGDACDLDDDGDGVADVVDRCPASVPSADADGDGCEDDLAGLQALTEGVDHTGLRRSLQAKLDAAGQAMARDNGSAAAGALGAFCREVAAQRGKKLAADLADRLLAYADGLRSRIASGP